MAQPKRRWSKARTGLKRSTWKLENQNLVSSNHPRLKRRYHPRGLFPDCSHSSILPAGRRIAHAFEIFHLRSLSFCICPFVTKILISILYRKNMNFSMRYTSCFLTKIVQLKGIKCHFGEMH